MPTNTETPRQESDREKIATIIQSGHIGHKTSDEIAGEVIAYVNFQFHVVLYNNSNTLKP